MATDEERMEVSRRLRGLCDYLDENELSLCDDDWPGILSDYIWPEDSGYHIYDEDCRRLADLIEPEQERTCVPIVANVDWKDCYSVECNGCGHLFGGFFDDAEEAERFARSLPVYYLRYCAGCGAKVVRK